MLEHNRKYLAALLAAAVLAGCSTTPEDTGAMDDMGTDADMAVDEYGIDGDGVEGGAAAGGYGSDSDMDPALETRVVYFDFDKATVRTDAVSTLQAHADYLSNNPGARMRVEGHADERGTREYNMALGERRAKAAASFLVANGASVSQIEIISYGEERPIALGHDDQAWAQNRRAELKYTAEAP